VLQIDQRWLRRESLFQLAVGATQSRRELCQIKNKGNLVGFVQDSLAKGHGIIGHSRQSIAPGDKNILAAK